MITLAAILTFFAGMLHGLREAYHADASIFEDAIPGTDTDFFGARAWLGRYKGGKVENGPKQIYKFIGNVDFWHVSRWVENALIGGAIWALTGIWYFAPAYITIIAAGGHLSYWAARK